MPPPRRSSLEDTEIYYFHLTLQQQLQCDSSLKAFYCLLLVDLALQSQACFISNSRKAVEWHIPSNVFQLQPLYCPVYHIMWRVYSARKFPWPTAKIECTPLNIRLLDNRKTPALFNILQKWKQLGKQNGPNVSQHSWSQTKLQRWACSSYLTHCCMLYLHLKRRSNKIFLFEMWRKHTSIFFFTPRE